MIICQDLPNGVCGNGHIDVAFGKSRAKKHGKRSDILPGEDDQNYYLFGKKP